MKFFIAIDIGGTTFNSGIFTQSFNQIAISDKDKIRNYSGKDAIVDAMINQVSTLISDNDINNSDIVGLGIASPGPLDPKKGIILNTPNLKVFQNYAIGNEFAKKLKISTFLENDANLFALGEWYTQYRKNNVIVGLTLGTGLGFGLIINGDLFTGGNGMAMEYGLSPFEWGMCEKNVSIRFIRNRAKKLYGKELSPRTVEEYWYKNDSKAIQIYHEFGQNLGIVLSHVVNMIDPQVITIGGGLSKAYNCFEKSMVNKIKEYAPSFNENKIIIASSKLRELSTMVGACIIVKNNYKL
tara:strand:+ start:2083 stop:2973 length:891 start_codon:yes stop_codon:yes gene_type:complete